MDKYTAKVVILRHGTTQYRKAMSPYSIQWTAPNLQRYRPVILALTALAAGCTIYYIHEALWPTRQAPQKGSALRRSNARRRRRSQVRRRTDTASGDATPSLEFLSSEEENHRVYGWHAFLLSHGELRTVPLTRQLLHAADAAEDGGFSEEEATRLREELQTAFLDLYLYRHLRSRPFGVEQRRRIVEDLQRDGGFSESSVQLAIDRTRDQGLRHSIELWIDSQLRVADRPIEEIITDPHILEEAATDGQALTEQETVVDAESEDSWQGDDNGGGDNKEGQSLLNLLYRIAEEQARREGFVHRGITCNGCSAHPIKGIRYRCANCRDFDLCEACEALQIHPKTHLFYKVRIPRSHLGHQPQQIKYPGKYPGHSRGLSRNRVSTYSKETGLKTSEVEGLWEQFRCLAATDWPADPLPHKLAIDRRTFEQMFLPTDWARPPPPSLIYDRVFSFYDTNNDNLIGFEELLVGLSNLNKRGPKEKWKRIFKGYDIDGDGYVNRKDFLRMFKAHYSLTKEMTREIVAGMEEEINDEDARDLITGGQPLSSAFTCSVPPGQEPRASEGKDLDAFGDFIVHDQKGAVEDVPSDDLDIDQIIAQRAEAKTLSIPVDGGTDVQATVKDIYNDPWPPRFVLIEDVVSVLRESVEPTDIKDVGLQMSIRIACHQRTALGWQCRQMVHRKALTDRRKRSGFYEGDGAMGHVMRPSGLDDSENLRESLGQTPPKDCVKRLQRLGRKEDIDRSIDQLIAKLGWPINNPQNLRDTIFEMADQEWTGPEMLKAFQGYTLDNSEIENFVRSVLGLFNEFTPLSPQVAELNSSAPTSRRSRSSSKVRFEDCLTTDDDEHETRSLTSMSSRSVPLNERWGGFEVPEPEEDVGREVLFQVTREAMNELLDPIFRLREDLWLEAQATKVMRQRNRGTISATVTRPKQIWEYLHLFLRQHRIKSDYPPESGFYVPTEAVKFYEYVKRRDALEFNKLTSEPCPMCKDARIFFGKGCKHCGSPSVQLRQYNEDEKRTLAVERCRTCLVHNMTNFVRPGHYCCVCGSPSEDRAAEDARLWHIISGCDDWSSRKNGSMLHASGALKSAADPSDNETKASSGSTTNMDGLPPREGSNVNSPTSKRSAPPPEDGAPIANGSVDSPVYHKDEELSLAPATPLVEGEAGAIYPEMALDLHESVRSFNEADLSIEEQIAQRPLEDLLKEAGYASVDVLALEGSQSPDTSPPAMLDSNGTSPPDPTLPQNRPDSIHHIDFNRSISPPFILSNDGGEESASTSRPRPSENEPSPDIATLKYWAALYLLEDEDEQRGGPGRLSEKEFMEIMLGERGKGLEFLGEWMNLTTF
ncbi:MAG: hypothetical protein Q9217_002549 [Psora testacea]